MLILTLSLALACLARAVTLATPTALRRKVAVLDTWDWYAHDTDRVGCEVRS